jgi:hypothetical protein
MTNVRHFIAPSLMLILVLAGFAVRAQRGPNIVRDGISFGQTERLSGVYFTNFENSTFVRCDRKKGECRGWVGSSESYGLVCAPAACAALEARIIALNGTPNKWGLFAVSFAGRRSIGPGDSKWLHAPARKVLVEHLGSVVLLETR